MMFQPLNLCYLPPVKNLWKQAGETMEDVSVASKKVGETSEWAGVALFAVAGVSLLALLVAVIALERASYER